MGYPHQPDDPQPEEPTMKWEEFNGASVDLIRFFQGAENGACPYIQRDENKTLVCAVEYMGDRSDVWIVEIRNGKEFARHNSRMLESIVWTQ